MSESVVIQDADDPQDIIHQAVQLLTQGELVAVPTETRYVVVADGLAANGVGRLRQLVERYKLGSPALAVGSRHVIWDYVPDLGVFGARLVRRCLPGPVAFEFPTPSERGLYVTLPLETQNWVGSDGLIRFRVPAHDVFLKMQGLMRGPLVMAGEFASTLNSPRALPLWMTSERDISLVVRENDCRYGTPSSIVRVERDAWKMIQEGTVAERTIKHLASHYFLFVCTGNTCRSPMAEGIFRRLLANKLGCTDDDLTERGYIIASAGISAALGSGPTPQAAEVLREWQIDLALHESRPLTDRLIQQADQIFTMTRAHREAILNEYPEAADRVQVLSRNGSDISDPFGNNVDVYHRCAQEIERNLNLILNGLPMP